jgi:hypothetical protein
MIFMMVPDYFWCFGVLVFWYLCRRKICGSPGLTRRANARHEVHATARVQDGARRPCAGQRSWLEKGRFRAAVSHHKHVAGMFFSWGT